MRFVTVFVLAILLAACASPSPPAPSTTRVQVVCGTARPASALTCDAAATVALSALPATHAAVAQLEIHDGAYCAGGRCAPATGLRAYVVVRMKSGEDLWVQLEADDAGRVGITSPVAPFPPSIDDLPPPASVVRSRAFPGIDIRCVGVPVNADVCVAWADSVLPAAPTHPVGMPDAEVVALLLTNGGTACSAKYSAVLDRTLMIAPVACP